MVPTTITGFVTFVAGTKARAANVNDNFSNYRGTLLPINSDTATASHNTHDLGSTEHYWRRVYLGQAPFINGSQIGKVRIENVYDGASPPDIQDPIANLNRVGFPKDLDRDVRFSFEVPDEYAVGNRIALRFKGLCNTTGNLHMETVAGLYRAAVTDAGLTTPANLLTTTSTITAPSTTSQFFTDATLKLTGATGLINGQTVTAGDVITVNFKRRGSHANDTVDGYFYLTNLMVDLNN